MKRALFKILVVPIFYLISLLPFPLLFLFSDLLFVVVYYVTGYRKKVVLQNLMNAFPEKREAELRTVMRRFYHHFCDVIFETIKLLTISKQQFRKRCVMTEKAKSTFQRYFDSNQSIVGVMGHCGNWEWGAISHQVYFSRMITGVYHPLSNKFFDEFMLKLRGRFGGDIVPMHSLYKRLISLRNQNLSTTIGLIADQTPPRENAYWTTFLNQDTPVFNGPEKLARKFKYPMVYLGVKKVARGYYTLDAEVLSEDHEKLEYGRLTELHTASLEKNILEQPHTWLWSHRRWKHKRGA